MIQFSSFCFEACQLERIKRQSDLMVLAFAHTHTHAHTAIESHTRTHEAFASSNSFKFMCNREEPRIRTCHGKMFIKWVQIRGARGY